MKVIVFGATGTVGAYSSIILKEKGYDVIAVGRRLSDNGFFAEHGISYYSVDITQKAAFNILTSVGDIDAVIHLAGVMPAQMEGYHPQEYIDSIMTGTLNVLDYAVSHNSKKFIFATSRADSKGVILDNCEYLMAAQQKGGMQS